MQSSQIRPTSLLLILTVEGNLNKTQGKYSSFSMQTHQNSCLLQSLTSEERINCIFPRIFLKSWILKSYKAPVKVHTRITLVVQKHVSTNLVLETQLSKVDYFLKTTFIQSSETWRRLMFCIRMKILFQRHFRRSKACLTN